MAVTDILFSGLVITGTSSSDSVATPIVDALGRSGVLNLGLYQHIAVFVMLKSLTGSSPTVQVIIAGTDGQATPYVANLNGDAPTWTPGSNQYRTSIGPGTSHNDSLGLNGRVVWNLGGTVTACTFYLHIEGVR